MRSIVAAIADLTGVLGVSLGGSVAAGFADAASDVDLHVYWRAPLAEPAARAERLARVADAGSVAVEFLTWGREDRLRVGGRLVELIYVPLDELQAEVEQAYGAGLSGEGFVTAQLNYAANGRLLHDAAGEVAAIRQRLVDAYPEATRRLVLRDNPFPMRTYLAQLRGAQSRGDLLYVQHRRYAVQMVFFNVLFALNRRYHPGEKRLLRHLEHCPIRPADCATRWAQSTRLPADDPALAETLAGLVDDLCLLIEETP
jgi:hypothetical protein